MPPFLVSIDGVQEEEWGSEVGDGVEAARDPADGEEYSILSIVRIKLRMMMMVVMMLTVRMMMMVVMVVMVPWHKWGIQNVVFVL